MPTAPAARRVRQVVRLLGLLKTLAESGWPSVHQLAVRFKTRRNYQEPVTPKAITYKPG